jgi:hypothetical protein
LGTEAAAGVVVIPLDALSKRQFVQAGADPGANAGDGVRVRRIR